MDDREHDTSAVLQQIERQGRGSKHPSEANSPMEKLLWSGALRGRNAIERMFC